MCSATVRDARRTLSEHQVGGMTIRELNAKLRRLAHNIWTRHRVATVDDLVQVGFEVAVKMAPNFDPSRGSFIMFIFDRVHGAMVDLRRLEGVNALCEKESVTETEQLDQGLDWLEELLVLDERAWLLGRVMNSLEDEPPPVRELVVRCAMQGQTLRQVAAAQGISAEAASKRYTRALRRIRSRVTKEVVRESEANRNTSDIATLPPERASQAALGS